MTTATTLVDLEIRVTTEVIQGRTFLTYVTDSPSRVLDLEPVSIRGEAFACRPDTYQAALIKKIELLHEGRDIDGKPLLNQEIKNKLEGIGRDLYEELFPSSMRALYREVRTRVKTLLIVSDEPWIPWELVKPYDDTLHGEIIDDDFFCGRFRFCRWLAGSKAPPVTISAGKIACVEGGGSPEVGSLPYAAKERVLIANLAQSQPRAIDVSPSTSTSETIETLLKTHALGLLHMVSHGEFLHEQPNESTILLADGRSFRAADLHGPTATRVSSNRPLVFLNACRVARQGWSLTGLGGWADRWVRRCGCGCFIGPQWVVNDKLAYEFACIFYRLIEGGESFGQATWAARQRLREIDPGNPAWLAFSVFAHPGGRIVFAQEQLKGAPWTETQLSAHGVTLRAQKVKNDVKSGRGHLPSPPEPYLAHRYTLLQTRDLVGRRTELGHLANWVSDPDGDTSQARVFNVVAIGGMGKSALAWEWFNKIAAHKMKPLAGRLWWSFYEHGATFEEFVTQALAYALGRSAAAIQEIPPFEREAQLLEIFDHSPFLIVLDGLERIMIAYARMDAARMMDDDLDEKTANVVAECMNLPASATDSFAGQHRLRKMQNPRAGAFLRKLVDVRASRFLVTTRLYPAELQDHFAGYPVPGSVPYFLKGLRGADSLKLWRALGVRGEGHQILPLLELIEHHPLIIRALAGEVACYRRAPGDFDRWRKDHPDFDPAELPLVQVRSHVLAYALRGLSDTSHRVAQTIAAFRMPAVYNTLRAILVGTAESRDDEESLNRALGDLEDRGLIGWDSGVNQYDMHPLVRGVIWSGLSSSGKQGVYEDLRAHFESIPAIYQYQVTDPGLLTPAVELCSALLHLGRYDEACRTFYTRISDTILEHLNSHQAIALLELFFPSGTDAPPPLSRMSERFEVMYRLATAYRANGQLARASTMFRRLIQTCEDEGELGSIGYSLGDLSGLLLALGSLREAEENARRVMNINRELKSDRLNGDLRLLGEIFIARGETRLAQAIFRRSLDRMEMAAAADVGLAECALRLGDPRLTFSLVDRALAEIKALPPYLRSESQTTQILILQARSMVELGDLDRAGRQLHQTLFRARSINDVEGEVRSLTSLAEVSRREGAIDIAREHLENVWESVERGPFTLLHADACNVSAEIEREIDKPAAVEAAEAAFRLAWCDGPPFAYHWGLKKARALLRSLGVSDPKLPPFDEGKHQPMEDVDLFSNPTWSKGG